LKKLIQFKQFIILIKKLIFIKIRSFTFENWGLGIGDWGLGIGDWAQSPIPNPQSPIPNPQFYSILNNRKKILIYLNLKKYI